MRPLIKDQMFINLIGDNGDVMLGRDPSDCLYVVQGKNLAQGVVWIGQNQGGRTRIDRSFNFSGHSAGRSRVICR